ncbi:hypothetical protein IAR50_002868 [Cryptococcus sp. DSM 104548]
MGLGLYIILVMYTGGRQGSFLLGKYGDEAFLEWEDVKLAPFREDGVVVSVRMELELKNFKGYRSRTRFYLRYNIDPLQLETNLLKLPLFFLIHAASSGVLEASSCKDLLDRDFMGDVFPLKKK